MPLNIDGLGIRMAVEAEDAEEQTTNLADAVKKLYGNMERAGSAGVGFGKKLGFGFKNIGRRGIAGISGALTGMVDAATSPQLDSAYASMYAGFNKSFSAMTVGMNTTEKEMMKARKVIGSVAFGLNEDMDAAAQTWAAFEKQGVKLAEVLGSKGFKGAMQDAIRVTSVFDIQGDQLANVITGLVNGFDFSAAGAGLLGDKIFTVGKAFGAGREAIQSWPAIFESLNNELADFGKQMSPREIEGMTLSVVQLGGALSQAIGAPAQSAMEIARTAFTTLASERKNIINMFRGQGGEFGEIARQLMETGGDANAIFEMMAKGDVLKFMDTLREMAKVAEQRGGDMGIAFQRLSGVMSSTLGPDVTFAMKGNWDKVQGTLASIPETIAGNKARGALRKAAEQHHKTGLTAGESWDRMVEGMKARLFTLSDKEIGGWQKNMRKGFNKTFGVISDLAKADGPLGEMTTRLLAVQRVGLSALIPGLSQLAPLFGGVADSALPVLTALGSMGLSFKGLGKMALGGGAIGLLFKVLQEGPKKTIKSISDFGNKLWEGFGKQFPEFRDKVSKIWDDLISGDLLGGLSKKIASIGTGESFGELGEIAGKFTRGLIGAFSKVDWSGVAGAVWRGLKSVLEGVGGFIIGVFSGYDKDVKEGLSGMEEPIKAGMGSAIIGAFSGLKDVVVDSFWNLFDMSEGFGALTKRIAGGVTLLLALSGGFRKKFISSIFTTMKGGARATYRGMKNIGMVMKEQGQIHQMLVKDKGLSTVKAYGFHWRKMGRIAGKGMKSMGSKIKKGMKKAGPIALFGLLMEGMEQMQERSKNISSIMASDLIDATDKASLVGEQSFMGIMSTLDGVFLGIPGMIGNALGISSKDIKSFYYEMIGGAEKGIATISELFSYGMDVIVIEWENLKLKANATWKVIGAGADVLWAKLKEGFTKSTNFLTNVFDSVLSPIKKTFMKIGFAVEEAFLKIKYSISEMVIKIYDALPDFMKTDWMTSMVKTWRADYEKFTKEGGIKGVELKHQKELDLLDEIEQKKREIRQEENKNAEMESKKSLEKLNLELKKFDIIGNVKEDRYKTRGAELTGTLSGIYQDIDRDVKRKIEASTKADEMLEKRTNIDLGVENIEQAGMAGGGRVKKTIKRSEIIKAQKERDKAANENTVNIEQYLKENAKQQAQTADALKKMSSSPVDAYITIPLDGQILYKGMIRAERRAAGAGLNR